MKPGLSATRGFLNNLKLVYLMELQDFKVARVSQTLYKSHDLYDKNACTVTTSHFAIAFLT